MRLNCSLRVGSEVRAIKGLIIASGTIPAQFTWRKPASYGGNFWGMSLVLHGTLVGHCQPKDSSYPQLPKTSYASERQTGLALACCGLLLAINDIRLKIPRRKPCGFDSRSGHHVIVLNLLCEHGHHFEGWFASGVAFRDQSERHLVHCPQCQSSTVSQLPSAPHLVRAVAESSSAAEAVAVSNSPAMAKLHRALVAMARKAENVGERFPEEARRIHYDEAPARTIRGVATLDETRDLLEEGILVVPAPVPPEDEMH